MTLLSVGAAGSSAMIAPDERAQESGIFIVFTYLWLPAGRDSE
ncbi:hypothetical protein [Chlorobaculum tepidum]|nr:hypothetical protein [Chlorobaculum tepidum]